MSETAEGRAFTVMLAHQRMSTADCHCRQLRLGESYLRHVINQLTDAGIVLTIAEENR